MSKNKNSVKLLLCLLLLSSEDYIANAQPMPNVPVELQSLPINKGRRIFPSPKSFDEDAKEKEPEPDPSLVDGIASSSPAFIPAQLGRKKFAEKRYSEAKEAFKTAIRLEPMNPTLWGLYEDAVREESFAHQFTSVHGFNRGNLRPSFEISKTDSYIELNTLYLVGHVKNITNRIKRNVELTARFFNKEGAEIDKAKGTLRSFDKSLLPNESSIFEIPLRDYPKSLDSFRVEVSGWE